MNQSKSWAAIATNLRSLTTLQQLQATTDLEIWVPQDLKAPPGIKTYSSSLLDHLHQQWSSYSTWIFALATGAVVRLIAPLLQHKGTDPAVLVLDPVGKWVISLTGGHQGGAETTARIIAHKLDATPVITGSASQLNLPGIDILGQPYGWRRGKGDWTEVSALVARGEVITVHQQSGSTLWQNHLPPDHPFKFNPDSPGQATLWIGHQLPPPLSPLVSWHPRLLWVGIGCEKNTPLELIETSLLQVLSSHNLAPEAIAALVTIDLKASEPGLIALAQAWELPLITYSAQTLASVSVPNPSPTVALAVGTPSVAEAAALQAPDASLIVPKQIIKGSPGAVTIAIAQSGSEYLGHPGHLYLVGTGPGHLDQITTAAKTAITSADAVIGYSLYIDLIKPLFRPGQIVESLPITQEKARAIRAIALAQWGLTVAVVSSGDCGIYGMAGLVLAELAALGWDGENPGVTIYPGVSALQSAAARVGSPLMHDLCTISLSDLLTPWDTIQTRIKAAAQADFVTILYNPRSRERVDQIQITQQIFLRHRAPTTPVAIVKAAYREDEQIYLTTLEEMLNQPIDMLTTVIIGNSTTYNYQHWLITPRGYD